MSLMIHCDQCDKYMYRTGPGNNTLLPFSSVIRRVGDAVFCSDECLQRHVRWRYLGEARTGILSTDMDLSMPAPQGATKRSSNAH